MPNEEINPTTINRTERELILTQQPRLTANENNRFIVDNFYREYIKISVTEKRKYIDKYKKYVCVKDNPVCTVGEVIYDINKEISWNNYEPLITIDKKDIKFMLDEKVIIEVNEITN